MEFITVKEAAEKWQVSIRRVQILCNADRIKGAYRFGKQDISRHDRKQMRSLRKEMQLELKAMQQQLGITFIYVTHDQEEALAISDRIAVMKDGHIMQIGTPNEIYAKPQNPFVAGFIGVSNFMDCQVEGGENGSAKVTIQGELAIQIPVSRPYTGKGKISARPEQLFFSKEGMPGKILFSTFLGDFIEYEVELDDGQNLIVNEYTKDTTEVHADGERVFLSFDPARISLYEEQSEEVLSL